MTSGKRQRNSFDARREKALAKATGLVMMHETILHIKADFERSHAEVLRAI